MKRLWPGLLFGAAGYAIAWSAGASPLWAAVVGVVVAVLAVALN